jgi:hypothetical protein
LRELLKSVGEKVQLWYIGGLSIEFTFLEFGFEVQKLAEYSLNWRVLPLPPPDFGRCTDPLSFDLIDKVLF